MQQNNKVFTVTFIVNFIFSMLTALLSLIVYNINQNTHDVDYIMCSFIVSLILTRVSLVKIKTSPRKQIILGSFIFLVGCILLTVGDSSFIIVFIGALLFGVAVGFIPPALLTILTNGDNADMNIGIYNTIVAIASIFSPIIGEKLYGFNHFVLFIFWLSLSIFMTIISILIRDYNVSLNNSNKDIYNLRLVLANKEFKKAFSVLLFSSISYGSIVTYLPIYFKEIDISIGTYYFFFWSGYILVQFLKKIKVDDKMIPLSILGMFFGQIILIFFNINYIIHVSAFIYGMGYGALFKIFYLKIANFSSKYDKNLTFSIIGLISYLGVGFAPIFLIPFNTGNWRFLFVGNLLYCLISLILFIKFERKK